jgi:hypothetical protein
MTLHEERSDGPALNFHARVRDKTALAKAGTTLEKSRAWTKSRFLRSATTIANIFPATYTV